MFDFIQEIDDVDLPGAIKKACEITHIEYTNTPMYSEDEIKCIKKLRNRNIKYTNELLSDDEALDYLYDRGLDEDDIKKWRLGLVPDNRDNRPNNYLAGRLAFPIMFGKDENSYCIGMAYRTLDEASECKYVYDCVDKTPSFKGRNAYLYGLNYAKAAAKKSGSIIIVEGYMDAISMHKTGYINTVASMGTELAATQIDLLKGAVNKVYLFWDGDKPGVDAVPKAIISLIKNGFEVFVIPLLADKDPADLCLEFEFDKKKMARYIKKNCFIGLRDIIDKKLSLFENMVLSLQTDIFKEINEIILNIPDAATREIYLSFVRKRLL